MTYQGTDAEVSADLRPYAAVETLTLGLTTARLVAPGSTTDGRFGLFRWEMGPRAGGAAPHFHRTFSESFYVLDGTVRIFDGRQWAACTSGDFVHVPEGGVHGFSNDSDEPASMLILFAPGFAREQYFIELAELAASGRELPSEERAEFLARHDQYMV
jgi:mannose-6-phosphate isomerase-like protein (cupin superfamily)